MGKLMLAVVGLILVLGVEPAHAAPCEASAPACDGTCPRGTVCRTVDSAGTLCACVPGGPGGGELALSCFEAKSKAAGKKVSDLMRAFGRNAKKPSATRLQQEVSKAEWKFMTRYAKTEERVGCWTTNDALAIEGMVNTLVTEVIESLE